MEDTQNFLRQVHDGTPLAAVEDALSIVANAVRRNKLDLSEYSTLLHALIDRIAPYISNNFISATSMLADYFDSIFLRGPAAPAFIALTSALRVGVPGADVLASTALFFVGAQTDGRRRLTTVLTDAPHDGAAPSVTAAALAHLPARIANAVCGTNSESHLLDESEHTHTLTHAMLSIPEVRDAARDALVAALLRVLTTLGRASDIVTACVAYGDALRATKLVLTAPETCAPVLLRAFLESPTRGPFAIQVASEVLAKSATARTAALHEFPVRRPLLRRPRVSTLRLVHAMHTAGGKNAAERGMGEVAVVWGRERFAKDADFRLQRQTVRVLLLYMRILGRGSINIEHDAMLTLARGVTARLDHGDSRVRRFGMVVGEAFSKLCGDEKPLKFSRIDLSDGAGPDTEEDCDGDSDFSDMANDWEFDCFAGDEEKETDKANGNDKNLRSLKHRGNKDGGNAAVEREHEQPKKWDCNDASDTVPEDWEMEDDWDSLDALSLSSESDGEELEDRLRARRKDYEEIRKKVAAPMSVSRILGLLRHLNSGEDVPLLQESELVCATLRTIASRAGEGLVNDTLYMSASEMCRAVLLVEPERFPPEEEKKIGIARSDALAALTQLDIANVGSMLISNVILSSNSDGRRRSEALALLADSARAVSERASVVTTTPPADDIARAESSGTLTRRLEHSLAAKRVQSAAEGAAIRRPNALTLCAGQLFFLLANGMVAGIDATTLASLPERDPGLFSQALATLSALVSLCGAGCPERSDMARALAELAARASGHSDSSVRRAAALAAGAAAGGTTASDVVRDTGRSGVVLRMDGGGDGGGDLLRWLGHAVENDGDVLVRRFAGVALRKWQRVIAEVAGGE